MRITHVLFLSILLLLCSQVWPEHVHAGVCQSRTAIVYGNGIFNTRAMARDSLIDGLQARLVQFSTTFSDPTKYEYKLAYADNGGATGVLSAAGLAQLYQAFVQKQAATISEFWRWLGGIVVAPAWFQTMMDNLAAATNATAYINSATLQKQLNGDPTNPMQPGYKALLNNGMKVIIVAHSQGNFYANTAYGALIAQNPAWSISLGIVGVATPDNRVAGGGPHITVPEDEVIAAVRSAYPSTLSTNPIIGPSPNMAELGVAVWANASAGHNFVEWYLAGTFTRSLIINYILNAQSTLQSAPSNMVPQAIMAGSMVATSPALVKDGGVYITTAGGVVELMPDGSTVPKPGVPKVEHVGPDGSLYYSDRSYITTSTLPGSIYKVSPAGTTSLVYKTGNNPAVPPHNSSNYFPFDVAADDGSVYFGEFAMVFRIDPAGSLTRVAGRPLMSSIPLTGVPALDVGTNDISHIKTGFNGQIAFGISMSTSYGSEFILRADLAGHYWYFPNTIPPNWLQITHQWGDGYDICPNGDVILSAGGSVWKYHDIGTSSTLVNIGTGSATNYASFEWSAKDDTIYFVDQVTGMVNKLVPSSQ